VAPDDGRRTGPSHPGRNAGTPPGRPSRWSLRAPRRSGARRWDAQDVSELAEVPAGGAGPASPEALAAALEATGYLPDEGLATAAYLALVMHRPLFLEGEAGVGKTALAQALATVTGRPSSQKPGPSGYARTRPKRSSRWTTSFSHRTTAPTKPLLGSSTTRSRSASTCGTGFFTVRGWTRLS